MSQNPFEAIRKACDSFGHCFQAQLSRFLPFPAEDRLGKPSSVAGSSKASLFSFFAASKPRAVNDAALLTPTVAVHFPYLNLGPIGFSIYYCKKSFDFFSVSQSVLEKIIAAPLTKEDLGRATWTLLHTVAAQFPDTPTSQQKQDVRELMAILSRVYPCKECADHFKEVLKSNPVQAGSQAEFSQWLCRVHNIVNRSLGKQIFPCERVNARWGKLDS